MLRSAIWIGFMIYQILGFPLQPGRMEGIRAVQINVPLGMVPNSGRPGVLPPFWSVICTYVWELAQITVQNMEGELNEGTRVRVCSITWRPAYVAI